MAFVEAYIFHEGSVEVRLVEDYLSRAEAGKPVDATLVMPHMEGLETRFKGLLDLIQSTWSKRVDHLPDDFPVFATNIAQIALDGATVKLTISPIPAASEEEGRISRVLDVCETTAQYLLGYVTHDSVQAEPPSPERQMLPADSQPNE